MLYSCSGGANVGEMADKGARQLMYDGVGQMLCVVGLGGDIQGMVQTAKAAANEEVTRVVAKAREAVAGA